MVNLRDVEELREEINKLKPIREKVSSGGSEEDRDSR